MPFKKGQSGNLNGRTKGSTNRVTKQLRESITSFLENNFERLESDFNSLPPRDRIKFYCDLLQYGLPKLQTVQLENDFEKLSDSELDRIISDLKGNLDE
jgi:hypothetical protein